jgi:CHAT domain-containing protein
MSHVISLYVLTLRGLEISRAKASIVAPDDEKQSLMLSMKGTVGEPDLDVDEEVAVVEELTSTETLHCPDKTTVLRRLKISDIVHFACRGKVDPRYPRMSTFLVAESADSKPARITVEDLAKVNPPGAQLAYLSACSTVEQQVLRLVEESLHLAGAFQTIGFPQVVGILWETKDWAARKVTIKFYRL